MVHVICRLTIGKVATVILSQTGNAMIPIQGCDSFVFGAILEFTLAQYLMRRMDSKHTYSNKGRSPTTEIVRRTLEDISRTGTESQIYSSKPDFAKLVTKSDHKVEYNRQFSLFMKLLGLRTFEEPLKGWSYF